MDYDVKRWCAMLVALACLVALPRCQALDEGPRKTVTYQGSSTVANFLRDAQMAYGRLDFQIDDSEESAGGERAIRESRTDLAGIADSPSPEVLREGIVATEIGRDAIAVVINAQNPIRGLSSLQLKEIFTGNIDNWIDLGGPDLALNALITAPDSATHRIFKERILEDAPYAGCQEIRPDRDILDAIDKDPGAIGQISVSFLDRKTVRALSIDGSSPIERPFDYPIARPLFLLYRDHDPDLDAFVQWTQSDEGQRIVMKRFIGRRVIGGVEPESKGSTFGTLVVYTETFAVNDGGIYYYPHLPYTILTRDGETLRRVQNHRGRNDENPSKIPLPPGTYVIRPDTHHGDRPQFLVTIRQGETTSLFVEELLSPKGGRP